MLTCDRCTRGGHVFGEFVLATLQPGRSIVHKFWEGDICAGCRDLLHEEVAAAVAKWQRETKYASCEAEVRQQ
jgi:hypothetical protein